MSECPLTKVQFSLLIHLKSKEGAKEFLFPLCATSTPSFLAQSKARQRKTESLSYVEKTATPFFWCFSNTEGLELVGNFSSLFSSPFLDFHLLHWQVNPQMIFLHGHFWYYLHREKRAGVTESTNCGQHLSLGNSHQNHQCPLLHPTEGCN